MSTIPSTDWIYSQPGDYDLEHDGDARDVRFFVELVGRLRPRRVLELACGSGRVTLPIGALAARQGFDLVGVDLSGAMLEEARKKIGAAPEEVRRRVQVLEGDMRAWRSAEPFDVIVVPCASTSHLLSLDDRLATWRGAFENLRPGGRFVVDVAMPDLRTFAESLQTPPRAVVEMDIDSSRPDAGKRLIRYKATYYAADEQRARIHFFYDKFDAAETADRYVSDFECHVYFPCELELLFLHTGFAIEAVYGSYDFRPLRASSRALIMVGRRPER
jgi:SAM-dependent methyltransferase